MLFVNIRVRNTLKEFRDEVSYTIHKHVTQVFFVVPKNQSHTMKITDQWKEGKEREPMNHFLSTIQFPPRKAHQKILMAPCSLSLSLSRPIKL